MLTDWKVRPEQVEDALLVVSELVANVIRHAGTVSTLELELGGEGTALRVALADGSSAAPRLKRAHPSAEDGRGLAILGALSDRWGVELHVGGKRVWWEVDLGTPYADSYSWSATTRRENATASA